jgi:hypothetical protein
MNKTIIFILLCLLIVCIIIFYNNSKKEIKKSSINKKEEKKPYLWLYWEGIMPAYISMCKETIYKHCSNSFNIIFLNDKNINEYLPELELNKLDFSKLKIAQRVDYYRILLLYKYGGLYMDIDILCMKNPIEIIMKLNDDIDFVGFGCTGNICKYGYGKPSNWAIASKPNTQLMKNILTNYEMKLREVNKKNISNKNINYFDFGKILIWEELDKLINNKLINNNNYKYFHYPNTVDGTRDVDGRWVTMGRLFSKEKISYDDESNLLFVVLYNSDLDDFDKSYRDKTKEELLNSDINFTKYYKKSMYI